MILSPARRFLLAGALIPAVALAAPKQLTLAFTGDNGGEVAPCG